MGDKNVTNICGEGVANQVTYRGGVRRPLGGVSISLTLLLDGVKLAIMIGEAL